MVRIIKQNNYQSKEYEKILPGDAFVLLNDYLDFHRMAIGPGHLFMKVNTDTRTTAINFVGKEITISPNELVVSVDLDIDWRASE